MPTQIVVTKTDEGRIEVNVSDVADKTVLLGMLTFAEHLILKMEPPRVVPAAPATGRILDLRGNGKPPGA